MQTYSSTPFGRRSLTFAMMASQAAAKNFTERPDAGEAVVHKWRLFRALTEAKNALGVSDRALSVLHALLSFHQETALTLAGGERKEGQGEEPADGIIVFPSNRELSIRAHGMAPATLRRHLAVLVDAGLILRRDSANGKRFARRGASGEIADAFGFDLTPLVMRASEIETLAEEVRAENRAMALLRERITLTRRDIAKMIEMALEEGIPGQWDEAHKRYAALAGGYARNLSRADLGALAGELATLAAEIRNLLETRAKQENMSANESQTERHIQNQTTKNPDLEPSLQEGRVAAPGLAIVGAGGPIDESPEIEVPTQAAVNPKPNPPRAFALGMVLSACPDIVDYGKGGKIHNWRDLADAAAIVRSALGVSPDAWAQALEVLGEHDAAIMIAAILQRGEEIRSAGGYLRALTEKARAGEFSLGPVLMALLRGKARVATRRAG